MFTVWHYLVRIGFPVLFSILLAGFLFHQNPALAALQGLAMAALFALGLTGAVLALLLLFTRFRLRCPACHRRDTEFGASKQDGMWLACEHCGLFEETGFLKLSLKFTPRSDEPPTEESPG